MASRVVDSQQTFDNVPVTTTVSIGVAEFRGDERAFFSDADRALYRAKDAGKDCVVAADDA